MNGQDDRRGEAGNYFQWHFDNRWRPDNRDATVARAYNRDDQYWAFNRNNSTYWWDNMAYARLKNLVLSYTIPREVFGNLGISYRSEEHTSELQSRGHLVCRLLLEKK